MSHDLDSSHDLHQGQLLSSEPIEIADSSELDLSRDGAPTGGSSSQLTNQSTANFFEVLQRLSVAPESLSIDEVLMEGKKQTPLFPFRP